tara:strand:+ start:152 stop:985 length:834 start_codon:yes stop_codon:yes gene_type:complete
MFNIKYFLIILALVSISISEEYQDVVYLNDGSIIKGIIIETEPNQYIKIKSGENIFVYQMDQIDVIKKEKLERYSFKDPNNSRYFFAPTASPISSGNSYIRTTWLFFPSYGFSLSENISTEIGMSVFPGLDIEDQVKQLSFKYSAKKTDKKWRSSFGFLYVGQIEFGGGFFFSSFTYGDDDKNFSITPGLGYFRNESNFEFAENLTLVLSSKRRMGNSVSLISENWVFLNSENLFVISNSGLRFFGKHLSVDFSWPFFFNSEVLFPGFPLLTFSYKF